jgi:HAD superfamily hydrolase (TIGR01458 family)
VRDDVVVRAVLLDIDGVLYVEDEPIPGATDAVRQLREAGLGLRFVTNTTNRSRAATLARLQGLGFAVSEPELLTPAALAVQLCAQRGHGRVALFAADELRDDFRDLEVDDDGADAVIVGDLGEAWDYGALNRAFRLVIGGADLIALQKNRYWRRTDGLALDAGPFVAALEYATERTATVVGKPARAFFEQALAEVGATPAEAVMVGDDIESDIGGALAAGLQAVLVRTGKYRADRVAASDVTPTATVDSIADVPGLLAGRDG